MPVNPTLSAPERQREENCAFRKGQRVLHETESAKERIRKRDRARREGKMKKTMDAEKAKK